MSQERDEGRVLPGAIKPLLAELSDLMIWVHYEEINEQNVRAVKRFRERAIIHPMPDGSVAITYRGRDRGLLMARSVNEVVAWELYVDPLYPQPADLDIEDFPRSSDHELVSYSVLLDRVFEFHKQTAPALPITTVSSKFLSDG